MVIVINGDSDHGSSDNGDSDNGGSYWLLINDSD